MTPNVTDWLQALGGVLGATAGIVAINFAARQLRGLVRQLKHHSLTAMLTLEVELCNRKQLVARTSREIKLLAIDIDSQRDRIEIEGEFLNECLDDWFTLADRLAFCILRRYLPEKDFKSEYFPYFYNLVNNHWPSFQDDSTYRNVIKLCKQWRIERPTSESTPTASIVHKSLEAQ